MIRTRLGDDSSQSRPPTRERTGREASGGAESGAGPLPQAGSEGAASGAASMEEHGGAGCGGRGHNGVIGALDDGSQGGPRTRTGAGGARAGGVGARGDERSGAGALLGTVTNSVSIV